MNLDEIMGSNLLLEFMAMGTYRYNIISVQMGLISIMSLQLQSLSIGKYTNFQARLKSGAALDLMFYM